MQISNRLVVILILIVFLIGLIFRVINLPKANISLSMDEAAEGYNAYSIFKTGKDEYGTAWPLSFRSTGDYKSPLLIYLMVPAIAVFGLNEFGIRITVALIGALTIVVVFFLTKLLTNNNLIALVASFSLAISPWHLKPSRLSHDVTLGLFLVLLGTLLFFIALKANKKIFWLSAVVFGLTFYAYHAQKVFTPLLLISLFLIYRKQLLKRKRELIFASLVGLVVIIPFLFIISTPQGRTRVDMTFLTKDIDISGQLHQQNENLNLAQKIFDNNFFLTFNFWSKRYLDYFDFNLLFVNGMGYTLPNAPDIGFLYLFELPFFLIGLYVIWVKKLIFKKEEKILLVVWLLIGPLAASLANNAKHHFRSLTLIPSLELIVGSGFYYTLGKIKKNFWQKRILLVGLSTVVIFSVSYMSDLYFIQYQVTNSEFYMDGWKEAVLYALDNHDKYKEVILDSRYGTLGPYTIVTPYIYLLFYGQIDPYTYQNSPVRLQDGKYGIRYQNFDYRRIDWTVDKDKKDILFIGSPWVLPAKDEEIVQRFYLYNGKEILRAVNPK
ncbi:glycosyltransferase family 39 protein [Candidatus Daviesbacteria bacterium]|nr:glycosyltransferase family 39 protein [Candidatus Daviesbacteria bacterium]